LAALAATPGQPLAREALGQQSDPAGGSRMVDVQMTRLRRKIEADPRFPRSPDRAAAATCCSRIDRCP
jgi:two-component system phosphate regulon response regulator OmpR